MFIKNKRIGLLPFFYAVACYENAYYNRGDNKPHLLTALCLLGSKKSPGR